MASPLGRAECRAPDRARRWRRSSSSRATSTHTVRQSGEYFTALSTRFQKARPSAARSTSAKSGSVGGVKSMAYPSTATRRRASSTSSVDKRANVDALAAQGDRLPRRSGRSRAGVPPCRAGEPHRSRGCRRPVAAARRSAVGPSTTDPTTCAIDVSGLRNSCETDATKAFCRRAARPSRARARAMKYQPAPTMGTVTLRTSSKKPAARGIARRR